MNSKEFKRVFNKVAKANEFYKAFGGWFQKTEECIIMLDLQKSNFGDYFQLLLKIYIQGVFGNKYTISKDLLKKEGGDIFRGAPALYKDVFELDNQIDDIIRMQKLESLFIEFIVPFADKALTRKGIEELEQQEHIFILPAVKQQLSINTV